MTPTVEPPAEPLRTAAVPALGLDHTHRANGSSERCVASKNNVNDIDMAIAAAPAAAAVCLCGHVLGVANRGASRSALGRVATARDVRGCLAGRLHHQQRHTRTRERASSQSSETRSPQGGHQPSSRSPPSRSPARHPIASHAPLYEKSRAREGEVEHATTTAAATRRRRERERGEEEQRW